MTHPLRTKHDMLYYCDAYFRRQYDCYKNDAELKLPIGNMYLTPQNTTLCIVRISERIEVCGRYRVQNKRGDIYHTRKRYWRNRSICWRVIEAQWSDGKVTELSQHATEDAAYQAMCTIHAAR
jgi:hypothetical protein